MNFRLDRSADNWKAELAKLKEEVGECPADEPLAPMGAMSTAFRLDCEKGKLDGILLLAPTTPPRSRRCVCAWCRPKRADVDGVGPLQGTAPPRLPWTLRGGRVFLSRPARAHAAACGGAGEDREST